MLDPDSSMPRVFANALAEQRMCCSSYLLDQRIRDGYLDSTSLLVKVLHRHAAHVTHNPGRAGFL